MLCKYLHNIGNMSSQILSIFYLSGFDHFIIHDLKLKYMVHYMDDICLLHKDKEYLKECLVLIKDYLKKLKLEVNEKKTRIVSVENGETFLGIRYLCINHRIIEKVVSSKIQFIKKHIRRYRYLYLRGDKTLESYFSMYQNYKHNYKIFKIKKVIEDETKISIL